MSVPTVVLEYVVNSLSSKVYRERSRTFREYVENRQVAIETYRESIESLSRLRRDPIESQSSTWRESIENLLRVCQGPVESVSRTFKSLSRAYRQPIENPSRDCREMIETLSRNDRDSIENPHVKSL